MSPRFGPSLTVSAAALLAAGLATGAMAQSTPEKIEQIGLMVQDMSNPFFSAMDKGAQKAAAEIGATVNTQDARLDLANQNTQVDAFIQQGVAAAVSCCNATLQPSMARVLATRVASDDCITVLLSRSQNAPLLRDALPGAIAVMKPSVTPAAAKAALACAMSDRIASWPVYVIGPTQTGSRIPAAPRGTVETPESGSA